MRTDDLIDALAADLAPRRTVEAILPFALALGLAGTAAIFFAQFGLRGDIAVAVESLRFLAKPVLALALASSALVAAVRLARPGSDGAARLLALPVLLAALFVAAELANLPAAMWGAALVGNNAVVCLVSIPALSAPVFVALIAALRRGAPTAPRLTGAVAGLAAAGFAATLYGLFCTDDSPLFVVTWYTLAAAFVAGAGALAGHRFLRW